MWHEAIPMLLAVALTLLTSVKTAAAMGTIIDLKTAHNPEELAGNDDPSKFFDKRLFPKLALGYHLEPRTFPHDNPFNITEEEALKHGWKLFPVDPEHWDALVNNTHLNLEYQPIEDDLPLQRRGCTENIDREKNPPDPTDWCTPSKNPKDCMFILWLHDGGNYYFPNRAWIFDNTCEFIGSKVPFPWGDWQEVCSRLRWVTLFWVNRQLWPHLAYAGRYYNSWDSGWELWYPDDNPTHFMYRRYFDCSDPKAGSSIN
ncbi:hypothetical protein EsH8_VIII_000727 [Colletotrichum jinshuiense]